MRNQMSVTKTIAISQEVIKTRIQNRESLVSIKVKFRSSIADFLAELE